jgi:hypothetical protein
LEVADLRARELLGSVRTLGGRSDDSVDVKKIDQARSTESLAAGPRQGQ